MLKYRPHSKLKGGTLMIIKADTEAVLCIASAIHQLIRDKNTLSHSERTARIIQKITGLQDHWSGSSSDTYRDLALRFMKSEKFDSSTDDELEQLLVQPLRKVANSINLSQESLRGDFYRYGIS